MARDFGTHQKVGEHNEMQNNLVLKANLEQLERQTLNQVQNNLNGQYKQMLSMKEQQRQAQANEERNMEKFIAERNRGDYEKYLAAANERKRWQNNMLSQDYAKAADVKKRAAEHEKAADREAGNLNTLGGVASGSNYARQMENQRRIEEAQKLMQKNFSSAVHNPAKEKMMAEREREARDFNDVKSRFDKEKMFIDQQKYQAKKLNDMQLKMQKDEASYLQKMTDDAEFQKK